MTVLFFEDFETVGNGTRYFTFDGLDNPLAEFTDNSFDFFTRTDGSNISASYSVTGYNGSYYFAMMDTNGSPGTADSTTTRITLATIDISGYTNLQFSGLFAEDDDGANQDWDDDDYFIIEYSIDGGAYQNLLAFESSAPGFNSEPAQDTDFDGVGDGTALTSVFSNFSAAIAGTGSNLVIRMRSHLESGDEDIAFDDIQVTGDLAAVLSEGFDSAAGFTGSANFFSDADVSSGFDFFGIYDPTNVASDFGGDSEPNAGFMSRYTGFNGSFVTAMDLDGEGGPNPVTLDWTGIDISALTSIEFTGMFAEAFAGDGNNDWDDADFVHVQVQIDGGGYQTILAFEGTGGSNTVAALDTDFDGVGDGTALTSAAQQFTAAIAGTGTTLDLRVTIGLNSGDEDIAFDDFVIQQAAPPASPGVTITHSGGTTDVAEGGATDTFDVSLDLAPTSQTDITLSVSDGETEISTDGVNFSTSVTLNFNDTTPQTITVRAVDDAFVEGNHSGAISFSVSQPGGSSEYDGMVVPDASVAITDNDVGNTLIHDIQGTGASSTMQGNIVTIEAVVVGDFQDGDADAARNLRGFFVQEEDADADGNAMTSEGLFIYEGGAFITDVNVGDVVQVTGTVTESFGITELNTITNITVVSSGAPLPTAAQITLPAAGTTTAQDGDLQPDLEAYEGMLVEFTDTLTITEMYNLDRFGEISLSQGGRLEQFTQSNAPDVTGYNTHLQDIGARTIVYDDGQNLQNQNIGDLDGFGPTFNTATDIQMGDTITNLSGVLDYSWAGSSSSGATWRVRSTTDGENTFTDANPRPTAGPDSVGSDADVVVASLNVLNYFTTLSGSTAVGASPRGADNATEFTRQTQKLVDAILDMNADVLGLIEIENDFQPGSSGNAVEYLVAQLNAVAGAGTYAWVNPGTQFVGGDAIANAIIYKPGVVQIKAGTTVEILDDSDLGALGLSGPIFNGSGTNRAVIAATFEEIASGNDFTVAVNHLKSKGSQSAGAGNADIGDGQGRNVQMRLDGANAVDQWLATDPTGSGNTDALLLGDFNSYAQEDPLTFLAGQGYTDLAQAYIANAYSYVFGGQVGTLDYILSSSSLTPFVTGATEWHVNSDEADALDYNTDFGRDVNIFDGTTPYRYSDHDPVLIGLNLDPYVSLFSEVALLTLELNSDDVQTVFDAASNNDAVNINDEVALGNVGSINVNANNLTVFADTGYVASYTLGALATNFTLSGTAGSAVVGNGANNVIIGGDGDDQLAGGDGNDNLTGGAGQDIIYTGDGADTADGGAGNDILIGLTGVDNLSGGLGNDRLYGFSGDDILNGGDGDDLLAGGIGNDTINAGDGIDLISGGDGDDTIDAGAGNDRIYTSGGNDSVDAGAGDDIIVGGAGTDSLNGGAGNDLILAIEGTNTLNGGLGNDIYRGGSGVDTYVFDASGGGDVDRVSFFEATDLIQLNGYGFANAAAAASSFSQSGGNVIFSAGGDIAVFYGATLADVLAVVSVDGLAELPSVDKHIVSEIPDLPQDAIAEFLDTASIFAGQEEKVDDGFDTYLSATDLIDGHGFDLM